MKVLDDIESEKAKHAESNRENDQEKGESYISFHQKDGISWLKSQNIIRVINWFPKD
jgi:hypothetical protein